MTHQFDTRVAELISIESAIIFYNLNFWIDKNKANDKHFYDGRYWTYNSVSAFEELFPYMTNHKIKKALADLEDKGFIVTGNYNNSTYDRTKWYACNDILHLLKTANGSVENRQPIPYSNTDSNTDKELLSENKFSDDNPLLIDLHKSNLALTPEQNITKAFFDLFRNNRIEQGVTSLVQYDKTKLKSWTIHIDRMMRIDGITIQDLQQVYVWLKSEKFKNALFWRTVIFSTEKLRQQMPKLQMAMVSDLKTIESDIQKSKDKTKKQSKLGL